jgi:deoxycytidine triphosphate deaminase
MSVLGKDELRRRLSVGDPGNDSLITPESWHEDSLRPAAYDLRIAPDWLITPEGVRYWPAGPADHQRLDRPFRINPGGVAFVSSVEDLRMPLDLAANIAVRFNSALKGFFVMGGLLVDPGYQGRLHFQLANIGADDLVIVPGVTSVAALQFLPVGGAAPEKLRVNDSAELLKDLFYEGAAEPLPPLAFFSNATKAQAEVAKVKMDVDAQKVEVEAAKRSSDQLVVFGVFLISASLFTAGIAALIDALASNTYEKAGQVIVAPTNWGLTSVVGALAVLVAIAVVFALMMYPVLKIVRANKRD